MKVFKKLTGVFLLGISLITSCSKKDHDLGRMLDKSEIKFEVVQDLATDPGGNTVILINKTPGTLALWDYGTGKSTRERDTVRFAFKGDYVVKFSALTGGGVVDMDPVTVKVTADNLNYVNDPLWTLLTGGVGNEKTWVLDVNANGDKKVFTSPVYFAGMDNAYGTLADDGKSIKWSQVCEVPNGNNCWTYAPNYTSDTWAADKKDYGYMTFSLKGGPFFKADHKGVSNLNIENGTYFLDINTKVLTTTDASILGVNFTHGDASNINSVRVISLTENTMQLAVKHKSKPEYQVLNFLSKTFSDNWTPPVVPPVVTVDEGFNPKFAPGGLLDYITGASVRLWKLDAEGNPIDWIAKGKGWTTGHASSRDWGWNNSWDAAVANSYIKFTKKGLKYTRSQNGVVTNGTFTVKESSNEITLTDGALLQNPGNWMNPTQTTLKVLKAFPNAVDEKGIWFGTTYDAAKDEWFAFHYVLF